MWEVKKAKTEDESCRKKLGKAMFKHGNRLIQLATTLLGLSTTACFIWSAVLLFQNNRSIELSFMLVLSLAQLLNLILMLILTRNKSQVICVFTWIVSAAIIVYLLVFIILTIVDHIRLNPLYYVMTAASCVVVIHIFVIISAVNYLRILHREKPGEIGSKLFKKTTFLLNEDEPKSGVASSTNSVNVEKGKANEEDDLTPGAVVIIPVTQEEDEKEAEDEDRLGAGADVYPACYNPFNESDDDEDYYPKSKNPFEEDDDSSTWSIEEAVTHLPRTSDYVWMDTTSGFESSTDPTSLFLCDLSNNDPGPQPTTAISTTLSTTDSESDSETDVVVDVPPIEARSCKHGRKMEYMVPLDMFVNKDTLSLPIKSSSKGEVNGNYLDYKEHLKLHKTPSVIIKKSLLPVPEYQERADFLDRLPKTSI